MALTPQRVRQIYLWHKWTGLISGLFILFISLTGTIAVFKNEIDAWLTPGRSVSPPSVTPQTTHAPLESIVATIERAYPKSPVRSISVANSRLAWDVNTVTVNDTTIENGKREKVKREVFLDPYTGLITGSRVGENLANIIRQAHLRFFYFGWQGRVAVGVIGVALLLSTLTGWMIYGPFMKKLLWGRIRWRQKLQLAVSDWHKMLGFATILFNLLIGLTGAALGLENLARFSPAAKQVLHPAPDATIKKLRPTDTKNRLTIDEAVSKAQMALPGFIPTRIELPRARKSHWKLSGNLQGHFATDGTSWVVLETTTGQALAKNDARVAQAATRAFNLSEPLHFGDFGGVPVKLIYLLLGLLSSSISISGFWLWILKSRKSKPQKVPVSYRDGV